VEFDELLEHLDDLIELAQHSEREIFAAVLGRARGRIALYRSLCNRLGPVTAEESAVVVRRIYESPKQSGQPCGCDADAYWVCERHRSPE
jgi:hypothetical protein